VGAKLRHRRGAALLRSCLIPHDGVSAVLDRDLRRLAYFRTKTAANWVRRYR
jgi:hypothetical protein